MPEATGGGQCQFEGRGGDGGSLLLRFALPACWQESRRQRKQNLIVSLTQCA